MKRKKVVPRTRLGPRAALNRMLLIISICKFQPSPKKRQFIPCLFTFLFTFSLCIFVAINQFEHSASPGKKPVGRNSVILNQVRWGVNVDEFVSALLIGILY